MRAGRNFSKAGHRTTRERGALLVPTYVSHVGALFHTHLFFGGRNCVQNGAPKVPDRAQRFRRRSLRRSR